MTNNDTRPWEDDFRTYLDAHHLARCTVNHHICMLKYDIVESILQRDFNGISIDALDPNTYLYMLQAKICLSGHMKWKDIWTAINYFREWKVGDNTVIREPDALALKQTVECILQGQQTMTKELTTILLKMESNNTATYEFRTSLQDRASMLQEKEEQLRKWEDSLRQRELDLQEKIVKMSELHRDVTRHKPGRKEIKGRDCIRKTQFPESTRLIRERTIYVHKKHNIGTSSNLLLLMIVMRDLGFLTENVDVAGFLRLMQEWEILTDDDAPQIHSISNSMYQAKKRLPENGKMDFRSNEWQRAIYSADKATCDKYAQDFLADNNLAMIFQ